MSPSRATGWGLDITVLGMVAFMVAVCGDVHRTECSRGRTIREFVTGVLFVPAGFTLMWMTVFGNSAIYLIMNRGPQASPILFSRMWRWPCLISGAFPVLFCAVIHCNGDGHRLLCNVC